MKATGRIKLSRQETLTHYLIVFFLLLPLFFVTFDCVKFVITGEHTGVRTLKEMFLVNVPFVVLSVVFFFIQYKRLKFKSIRTNLSDDAIQKIIETTATELEWIPFVNRTYYKVFKTFPKWYTGSWGERITLIIDNNKVMVNSICDPDKRASVVSVGRNRKNMRTLIDKLEKANH